MSWRSIVDRVEEQEVIEENVQFVAIRTLIHALTIAKLPIPQGTPYQEMIDQGQIDMDRFYEASLELPYVIERMLRRLADEATIDA